MAQEISQAIEKYVVLAHEESTIDSQFKEKVLNVRKELKQIKDELMNFAMSQPQSCITVQINPDNPKEKIYLRKKVKMVPNAINVDRFKEVAALQPTPEELTQLYVAMCEPCSTKKTSVKTNPTLADVYTTWLYNQLYQRNTVKKMTFDVSQSAERQSKADKQKAQPAIQIPTEILTKVQNFVRKQQKIEYLNEEKTDELVKIQSEKQTIEPQIDNFLQSRPVDKQSQKVTMNFDGEKSETRFVERVRTVTKPASITLAKTKPLISSTIFAILDSHIPFNSETVNQLYSPNFANIVFHKFCEEFSKYQQEGTKVSTCIKLNKNRGRKRKNEENNNEENDDNNNEENEENDENNDN